jgi:hypothetical protein
MAGECGPDLSVWAGDVDQPKTSENSMATQLRTQTAPQVTFARPVRLALIACCCMAPFAELAQAEDLPRKQVWVRLHSDLLVPLIERPIDEVQAVAEVILGVRSIGHAHVSGQPTMTVIDEPDTAAFTVTVVGTIHSRTTGRRGPVKIYSRSTTQFRATKHVVFVPGRGFVGEAATIVAQTSGQPERIESNRRGILGGVIERRAWARAAQSREQVNQIVRAMAEAKVREAFDRILEARLARVNQLAEQRYLVAVVVGGSRYYCWTSGGWLNIVVSSADDSSPFSPQGMEEKLGRRSTLGQPIQVWVHERVLGERVSELLRRVDLARQVLTPLIVNLPAAAAFEVALLSPPSSEGQYDFATIGDWFVIHAGGWSRRRAAAVASADVASTPRAADRNAGK